MKRLMFLVLAIGSLAVFVSCGSDDEATLELFIGETEVGSLVVNGYVITGYQCCNEGPLRADEIINNNFSRTTFLLTDGEFEFDANGNITQFINTETNLWIEIQLAQEGQGDFEPGEYTLLDDCFGLYTIDNTAEVYAEWYPAAEEYVYYYEQSGTVNVSKSGNSYSLGVNGTLIDYQNYNPPVAAKVDGGACEYYGSLEISGKFKGTFTEIPYQVYSQWD